MAKSLYADPREVKDPDGLAKKLAPLIKMDETVLRERLKVKGGFIWLKRTLEPAEHQRVAELIAKGKPGCPYDNAVSEATYKAFKTEFVNQYQFET